uniref:Uncharacterized protein n=1 Tax=Peronospora matthiolae TaxID=2874970 RepID=A0AAV1TGB9_9STRA
MSSYQDQANVPRLRKYEMFKVGDMADRSAEIKILEGDRQPVEEIEINKGGKLIKEIDYRGDQ